MENGKKSNFLATSGGVKSNDGELETGKFFDLLNL